MEMIKTDFEEVYDPYLSPLLDLQESFEMNPQKQGNFNYPYYQQHNQAQQIRQQQHYLQMRQEQQRHLQHQQQIHQQQMLRQEQLRMQHPYPQPQLQTFHQTNFRSNLPQFQHQTGWRSSVPPQNNLVRLLPRLPPREERPAVILQRRHPDWVVQNVTPQVTHPIAIEENLPPLVSLECEISPLSENSNQELNSNDDFKDFDVTDLLYLSFADEKNESSNRKRRSSTINGNNSQVKRRRTKAEIIADRNRSLKELCVECSIKCEELTTTSSHVRIFGNKILRENLPNVPNMKLTPKTIDFIRIRNIGYMVTRKGVCFSCLGPVCKFKSYDQNKFREHLEQFHKVDESGTMEGFCEICKRNCCGYNVIDEFIHIKYFHAKSIDNHPMHQILHSHIVGKTKTEEDEAVIDLDESSNSLILNENDSDFEEFLTENNKTALTNDFDDDDYHPSSSEEEEEIESESMTETSDESLIDSSESEAKSTSDEEEQITDLHSNDDEHRKKKKLKNKSTEDEIPQYILDRIKNHSISENNENKISRLSNESLTEIIEELVNENQPKKCKKQKKSKRKEQNFARKSTSKYESQIQTFSATSPPNLRPCRVVLTRCKLQEIQSPTQQVSSPTKESLKMIIKRTDKNIQIVVPDIPTPPSSEDSRDSLSTPPLNKSTETTSNFSVKEEEELNIEGEIISETSDDKNMQSDHNYLKKDAYEKNIIQEKQYDGHMEDKAKQSNELMEDNNEKIRDEEISEETSNEQEKNNILNARSEISEIINEENETEIEKQSKLKEKNPKFSEKILHEEQEENKLKNCAEEDQVKITYEAQTIVDVIQEKQDVSEKDQNENVKECNTETKKEDKNEFPNVIIQSVEILNYENKQDEKEIIILSSQESTSSIEIITNPKESTPSILIDSRETSPIPIIEIESQELKTAIEIDSRESSPISITDVKEIIPTIVIDDNQSFIVDTKKLKTGQENPICIEIIDDDTKLASTSLSPKSRNSRNTEKAKGKMNSIEKYFSPNQSANKATDELKKFSSIESNKLGSINLEIYNEKNDNQEVNLSELYPWIDRNVSCTVFKTKQCFEELKNEFCQFSTYKCMTKNCNFYTTDIKNFEIHVSTHDDDHHFCSFCLYDGVTSDDLCQHIEKLHKHDRYQCNFCMYRACEKVYVEWHLKRYHKDLNGKILKSPSQSLMKSVRNRVQDRLKNENREKFVQSYNCKIPECKKVFYCEESYRKHLVEKSKLPNVSQHFDIISQELKKFEQLCLKGTKQGIFQCLHCEYGSDSKEEIQVHLTDIHPYGFGFICRRKLSSEIEPDTIETLDNATAIEYIGLSTFKMKFYTEARAKLTKDQNTSKNIKKEEECTKTQESSDIVDLIEKPIETIPKSSSIPIINEIIHIDSNRCLPIFFN